jgi:type I restriction enzyme, S subunit
MPELRFPGFDAPWKISTIAELGKVVTGGTPNTSDRSLYGGYFMFVSPSDIGDARYVNTTTKTLTEAGHKTGRRIPKGSIVFVCIGSTIGKVAQVVAECTTNQQINAVIPNGNHDANFLLCVLDKEAAQIRLLAGKQAVPIINKSTFAAISITIPTLPEQRKIADFLTAVDGRIGQLRQKKVLLEDYKKGVMQQLFTQALRFKDDHGNEFPDWEENTLGDLCKIRTGKKDVNEGNPDGVYPFFTCAKKHTYSDNYSFDTTAILIAGNGEVGHCLFYEGKFEAYQRTYVLSDFKRSVEYIFPYLNFFFRRRVDQQKQMGAMPYIKLGMLTDFPVPIPSSSLEQSKIAEFVSALDLKIESVASQITHTQAFKKGLLQQMFV